MRRLRADDLVPQGCGVPCRVRRRVVPFLPQRGDALALGSPAVGATSSTALATYFRLDGTCRVPRPLALGEHLCAAEVHGVPFERLETDPEAGELKPMLPRS